MSRDRSRAVLFDYGGVLGDHYQREAEEELAGLFECSREMVRSLLSEKSSHGRDIRCAALSERDFWAEVTRLAGLHYTPAEDRRLTRLWCETYSPNAELFRLASDVRRSCQVGIVTNIDEGRSDYLVREVGIRNTADIYLPSFELGVLKGGEGFWRVALRRIEECGVSAALYVDDRAEHVASAQANGVAAVRFEGSVERLRTSLEGWVNGNRELGDGNWKR